NPRLQYAFVQDMVDQQTRFISIADNIDTGTDDWETTLMVASVRHGLAVPDARRRVRRTATQSFREGGMVLRVKFGYRKLGKDEPKTVPLREAKVPEATPIFHEIRRRLMAGELPVQVMNWLNRAGISPGPKVKSGKWTVAILKNALCDPKLHGTRLFRR